MKNAVLLHGTSDKKEYYDEAYPSLSNSHWFPWLQKQLLIRDIPTATPEMYQAYKPDYEMWKRELERYDITPETILVGHSCGGGFLVRWLSEQTDTQVGKVVLVAPWLDPENKKDNDFFDFAIDSELVARTAGVTVFASTNDHRGIKESVDTIVGQVKDIKLVTFENYGHFVLSHMGTEQFPELIDECLG